MVHQSHELADRCFADEIEHVNERRMPVMFLAALHELDSTFEVIDNGLIARRVPIFTGVIEFPTCHHDPERSLVCKVFLDLVDPSLFLIGQPNIGTKLCDRDFQSELLLKIIDEPVDEMFRIIAAFVDEIIFHFDDADVIDGKPDHFRDVWIVFPDFRHAGLNIGQKLAGVGFVQITNSSGEHENVTGALMVAEHEFLRVTH